MHFTLTPHATAAACTPARTHTATTACSHTARPHAPHTLAPHPHSHLHASTRTRTHTLAPALALALALACRCRRSHAAATPPPQQLACTCHACTHPLPHARTDTSRPSHACTPPRKAAPKARIMHPTASAVPHRPEAARRRPHLHATTRSHLYPAHAPSQAARGPNQAREETGTCSGTRGHGMVDICWIVLGEQKK